MHIHYEATTRLRYLKVEVVFDVDFSRVGLDAEQVAVLLGCVLRKLVSDSSVLTNVAISRPHTKYHCAHRNVLTRPHLHHETTHRQQNQSITINSRSHHLAPLQNYISSIHALILPISWRLKILTCCVWAADVKTQ